MYSIYKVGRESAPPSQASTVHVAEQKEAIRSLDAIIADQRVTVDQKDKELQRINRELTELSGRLNDTTRRHQASEAEVSRLKQELKLAVTRITAAPQVNHSPGPADSVRSAPTTPDIGKANELPTAKTTPLPHRQSIDLVAGKPVLINQTLTVTLNYTKSYGGQFVINGRKISFQTIGTRIDVSAAVGKKCFLEVMTLSAEHVSPSTAQLDYVCASS